MAVQRPQEEWHFHFLRKVCVFENEASDFSQRTPSRRRTNLWRPLVRGKHVNGFVLQSSGGG